MSVFTYWPGLWRMLSFDPHLDVTLLRSIFLCTIWTCKGDKAENRKYQKHVFFYEVVLHAATEGQVLEELAC